MSYDAGEQIYIVWKQAIGGQPGLFVVCSASSDSGQTWGTPIVVNAESREAFRCCLDGNPATGDLFVGWVNNYNKQVWFSRGEDDTGIVWDPEPPSGFVVDVAPNPCSEFAVISAGGFGTDATVVVADLAGRSVVKTGMPGRSTLIWDTTDIPPGVYIVSVRSGNLSVSTKAVVIHQ